MDKKAQEKSTLVELIIFAALFFVAFTIGYGFYSYFTDQPDTGTTKSLEALKFEINTLELEESRTVPIYIDEKYVIKGFFKDTKEKPTDCKPKLEAEQDKACLCLCKTEACDQIKKEVILCKKIDIDLKEEYILKTKLDEKENPITQNCALTREKQEETSKITISCS